MGPEASREGLLEGGEFLPELASRQVGEDGGIGGALEEGLQHGPPGDPEDVGRHRGELDPRILEDLVEPVRLPAPLLDEDLAVPGEVPEVPDRGRRHIARDEIVVRQRHCRRF